jgi:hypothetical protein
MNAPGSDPIPIHGPCALSEYFLIEPLETVGIILIASISAVNEGKIIGNFLLPNVFHSGRANLIIMTGQEISVNIPPTLDPVYSNMIQIAYKDDEFTFMFLHQLPQVNQARAKAIVSITPAHAKNLLGVLTKTVADYESKFGTISPAKEAHGTEKVSTLSGYS